MELVPSAALASSSELTPPGGRPGSDAGSPGSDRTACSSANNCGKGHAETLTTLARGKFPATKSVPEVAVLFEMA